MDLYKLFNIKTHKFRPKNSFNIIQRFLRKYKNINSLEMLKRSREDLSHIPQKTYLIQATEDGDTVRTFCINIYKDRDLCHVVDNKRVKGFKNEDVLLKYKMSKIYNKYYKSFESVEYRCFDCSNMVKISSNTNEFINNAYRYGKRIYIV